MGKHFLKSHWFTQKSFDSVLMEFQLEGRQVLGCGGAEQQELWGDGAGSALQALGAACYQILLTP